MDGNVPYHVTRCTKFLDNRLPDKNFKLVGSFKSFITSLKFHRFSEKPTKDRIYICMPDANNTHDANAIGVHANIERLGYVPKDLAEHIRPKINLSTTVVLAYCTGRTTKVSSQCIYHIFESSPRIIEGSSGSTLLTPVEGNPQSITGTNCTLCVNHVANVHNFPCGHVQYCHKCILEFTPPVCTKCRETIQWHDAEQ